MKVYKLFFFDVTTASRFDLSFFLRSAAMNLPDWLVEWYREGVETKMRFENMPLWACKDVGLAVEMMGFVQPYVGHYEVWECEGTPWQGHAYSLSAEGMRYLARNTDKYDPEVLRDAELAGEMGWPNDTIFCETIKPLRRVE